MTSVLVGLLAFPALFFARPAAASVLETNLVQNPGFEDAAKPDGMPSGGWWLYTAQADTRASVDRVVAHTGKASVRLQASDKAKSVLVSAPFAVAPGDELRFGAWVRGQDLPPAHERTYAGVAFRQADGRVFNRCYFPASFLSNEWSHISGVAEAPDGATTAEVHLGYTNAPAALWFDDVEAVITSPVSFSMVEGAKPWTGAQEVTVLVVNRQSSRFAGSIRAVVGKQQQTLPVKLEPGTSRRIKVTITLTGVGPHNYTLSLFDDANAPLGMLKGKFQTKPPLLLYPPCPCYHAVGDGNGDTRIDARINVNPAQRANLQLSVTVHDAAGKSVQIPTADASKEDYPQVDFRLPIQEPGTYDITARLMERTGKELAQATTDVHVVPRERSVVTMGPDGFLRIGGKPNFPIGMYSCGHYEEMGKAGFTATHNYGITTGEAADAINPNEAEVKTLLDKSWANGMRMMVELPRKAIEKAQWQQVRRRIETFRHHPGLLCWGSEERVARGEAPLSHIAALYRLVHELDPDHPLVLGDTKDVIQKLQVDRRDFFPDACMDAGIWWWYPIPLHAPDGNGLEGTDKQKGLLQPPPWLTTTFSKKPLWIAIQSYQHPRLDARFPTPAEYRCMAYLSIINGVKGLWFYTGSGQRDYYGKPAGLLNKPEEAHWDYVQKLVRELREFSPIIMAPALKEGGVSPSGVPVEFALRQFDGKLYVIAANKSDRPQSVRFIVPALSGPRVKVLYEDPAAAAKGDVLADRGRVAFGLRQREVYEFGADFPAFGVHVYKLE